MRNLLALVAAIVLIFLALGAWRGWYGVSRQAAEPGKFAFRFEVDAVRIGGDLHEAARSLSRRLGAEGSRFGPLIAGRHRHQRQ